MNSEVLAREVFVRATTWWSPIIFWAAAYWYCVSSGAASALGYLAVAGTLSDPEGERPEPRRTVLPAAVLLVLAVLNVLVQPAPGGWATAKDNAAAQALAALSLLCLAAWVLWQQVRAGSARALGEQRLRQDLACLRTLTDNIPEAVVTEDLQGRLLFANEGFYRLFGLRRSDCLRARMQDFIHPHDLESWRLKKHECVARQQRARLAHRGIHTDGISLELETSLSPLTSGGVPKGMQYVLQDVSRQRLIEKSQRALAQRLDFFVSEMPLGCVIWNPEFTVQEWNESAYRIFGWTHAEVLSRRYVDFLAPPEDAEAVEQLWQKLRQGKQVGRRLCANMTKNRGKVECEWFHTSLIDESGAIVAVASMVQDVTERKILERQLLRSQKMEAVGTLAGGIAHDFNNLLTTMLGNISLALMKLGPVHEATPGLRDAETAAEHAAELTQQLLRFGRKTPPRLAPLDLNGCVRHVVRLLEHGVDPQTEIEVDLHENLWPVEADAGQIEQVIMNLCVNARDAIAQKGRIRITTRNRPTSGPDHRPMLDPDQEGGWVEVKITDNGCGMDEDTQARIFEPFFSTKEVGKGNGLGLSMVYAIVRSHRGSVEVLSQLGHGSTFRVLLPPTAQTVHAETPRLEPRLRFREETILVADDDDGVRELARQVLSAQGHPVLQARDGQEAVETFRAHRDCVRLVVLDLTMPRQSGWEAFEQIHRLAPAVPVIMMSGYSLEGGPEVARRRGVRAFLSKPFRAQTLLAAVQKVLDERSADFISLGSVTLGVGD